MRVAFLHSDKTRERLLADAFLMGARAHGHETTAVPLGSEEIPGEYDVACFVGVKSRELFKAHHARGTRIIYLDKGYCRQKRSDGVAGWEYWRVAIDAHQPTARLAEQRSPADRLERLGLTLRPFRRRGEQIVLAGSSAKYHEFYGLKEPTAWMRGLVRDLRELTGRELVYRPKPSWREAVPITKTRFSTLPEGIGDALKGAHALVTHGSNACFEAILSGVPCVVLGDAVAGPISAASIAEIEALRIPSQRERWQWLANLSYWQWTEAEFASGEAWATIGGQLHNAKR